MRPREHSDRSRVLLATLAQDAPPANAKQRALMALGVGEVAVSGGVAAAASAAATGTKASVCASAVGAKAVGLGVSVWLKPLLLGATAGAVAVGAATVPALVHDGGPLARPIPTLSAVAAASAWPTRTAPTLPAPIAAISVPSSPVAEAPIAATSIPSSPVAEAPIAATSRLQAPRPEALRLDAPGAEPAPVPTAGQTSAAPAWGAPTAASRFPLEALEEGPSAGAFREDQGSTGARPTLGAELSALEAVRALLAAGQHATAARALDNYERTFPTGLLRPEAAVLRIEMMVGQGDIASAKRLASAFERENPQSSHLRKIRSVLGDDLASAQETPGRDRVPKKKEPNR